MTLDTIVKLRLKRKPEQYAGASPNAIASGSKAQMMYFVEDAKSDIAALLDHIEALRKALEPFVEAGETARKVADLHGENEFVLSFGPVPVGVIPLTAFITAAALSGDRP